MANQKEQPKQYTKGKWEYREGVFDREDDYKMPMLGSIVCDDSVDVDPWYICRIDNAPSAEGNAELICAAVNACISVNPDQPLKVAEKLADAFAELKEADRVICELCYKVNPQHATADNGKGCKSCEDRERRLFVLSAIESGKE